MITSQVVRSEISAPAWIRSNRIGAHGNACTCGQVVLYNAKFGGDCRLYACPSDLSVVGTVINGSVIDVYRSTITVSQAVV